MSFELTYSRRSPGGNVQRELCFRKGESRNGVLHTKGIEMGGDTTMVERQTVESSWIHKNLTKLIPL